MEGLSSTHDIKNFVTRKELSDITKSIARTSQFSFDSYYSNWNIVNVTSEDNLIITLKYIDLFFCQNYSVIAHEILKLK